MTQDSQNKASDVQSGIPPALTGGMQFNLSLNTLDDMREFCKILASTDLVPKNYIGKHDAIMVAAMMGKEVGLPLFQSLQAIAVINGIPSIFGDAGLALVRASGKLTDIDEFIEVDGERQEGSFPILKWAEEGKAITAVCRTRRTGASRDRVTTFSVDDAQRAGLWKKPGPWQTVPQRMLMWRARGWNLRDNFGDVLKGLAIYEEAMDIEVSRGNDGVYRAPVEIPAEQSDAEMKRIQDLMNQQPVEQDGAGDPGGSSGKNTVTQQASDAAPPSTPPISEEDWSAAVNMIEEDPNLRVLKDLVKVNMKIKTLKLVEKGKREFIRQFRIECEKENLGAACKRIFG